MNVGPSLVMEALGPQLLGPFPTRAAITQFKNWRGEKPRVGWHAERVTQHCVAIR